MQREKPWLERHALCGNVARKPNLGWSFLVEKPPQVLDVLADSDWA